MSLMRPVEPANLLGLPAAAVPAGMAAGLPAGVQIMGERFQDLACLEAAEAVEAVLGLMTPVDAAVVAA
jgi:amidase